MRHRLPLLACFLLGACQNLTGAAPAPNPTLPDPALPNPTLGLARAATAQGLGADAIALWEHLLAELAPGVESRAEALYELALLRLQTSATGRQEERARLRLLELERSFPDYRPREVALLLSLLAELNAKDEALARKDEALRKVTDTLIGR